jgi:hypothetical protein
MLCYPWIPPRRYMSLLSLDDSLYNFDLAYDFLKQFLQCNNHDMISFTFIER